MDNFPWTLEEVLGIPPTGRHQLQWECPKCGSDRFFWNVDKQVGRCWKCSQGYNGSTGYNSLTYYAEMHNLTPKEADKKLREELKLPVAERSQKRVLSQKKKVEKTPPELPLEIRHAVYERWNQMLTLSPQLVKIQQEKRLLTPEECRAFELKDIPGNKKLRMEQAKVLQKEFGDDILKNHPLTAMKNGWWTVHSFGNGMAVWIYSANGLKEGVQWNNCYNITATRPDQWQPGKYMTLCPGVDSKLEYKTTAQSHISWEVTRYDTVNGAVPLFKPQTKGPFAGKRIAGITEGPLKARIAHHLTGTNILAVLGVNNTKLLPKELRRLRSYGVEVVFDLFDMDYQSNDKVAAAMVKIKEMIEDAGMDYVRYDWNPKYKGIDDNYIHLFRGDKE